MREALASRRPRASLRTWAARALVWPAGVIAIAVHLNFAHRDYSPAARWHAGLLCCIALVAAAFSPVGAFPTIAIGLGYFYAALGMPVFGRTVVDTLRGPLRPSSHGFDNATQGALILAATALLVGWLADQVGRKLSRRFLSPTNEPPYIRQHTLIARYLSGFALCAAALMTFRSTAFTALRQPLTLLSAPIIPLTFLLWDAEKTGSKVARYLFWGAAGSLFLIGLMSGMLGSALLPLVTAAGLLWTVRGRLPLGLLVAGVLLVLVLNPAKHAYRDLAWYGRGGAADRDELTMWGEALARTYAGKDSDESLRTGIESTNSRVSTLGQVAQIYDWVPSRIRFAGPERWLFVPTMLIPRALWPNKPIQTSYFNRNYTETFMLQSERHVTATSITLPTVGDGYWRLGTWGVVIEGILLGVLLGIGQGLSASGGRTALLVGGSLMILRTDYHVFGTVNGCLQGILVMLAVAWGANALGRNRAATTSPRSVAKRAAG